MTFRSRKLSWPATAQGPNAEGGALEGHVRNRRSGAPVAPFTVLVQGAETRGLSVIDPAGRYAFDDLAPGDVAVQVFAPGYSPSPEVRTTIPAAGAATLHAGAWPYKGPFSMTRRRRT